MILDYSMTILQNAFCMTMSDEDIYDGIPLDSALKSLIELNHTTLLGCTSAKAEIECKHWLWKIILTKYSWEQWWSIIYMNILMELIDVNHCWVIRKQTFLHSMQCIMHCKNWLNYQVVYQLLLIGFGIMCDIVALIGIRRALFTVNIENQIQDWQEIIEPILEASYDLHFCEYYVRYTVCYVADIFHTNVHTI